MRLTASLSNDAPAKTTKPVGVPENGPATVRARPAALPMKVRMRMVLAFMAGIQEGGIWWESCRCFASSHSRRLIRKA